MTPTETPPPRDRKDPGPSPGRVFYDLFSSVTLAIGLLIALAVTSIFGTVIEQGGDPANYLRFFKTQWAVDLTFALGLNDMYHSWWFLGILLLLLVNITLCSAKRIPRAWKLMTDPPGPLDDDLFRRLKYRGALKHGGDAAAAEDAAAGALRIRFRKEPKVLRQDGSVNLVVDKGGYGRMGVYVTHLSLIILAAGVIYGGALGFRGFVNIPEGGTVDRFQLRGKNAMRTLDFAVRCDNFQVDYYPGTMQPKDYYSDLTVLRDGKEGRKKRIEVNHPLIEDGIYFYQSSYGMDPSSTVTLQVVDASGRPVGPTQAVALEKPFKAPGDDATYLVHQIIPNLEGRGLAAEMAVFRGDAHEDFYLVQAMPDLDRNRGAPVVLRLTGAEMKEYTGLQVAWDPGVPVIWLGCIIMMAGLMITFFVAHQRVWVRVDNAPGNPAVTAAGSTSRNPASFEREFEGLLADLKASLKKGPQAPHGKG